MARRESSEDEHDLARVFASLPHAVVVADRQGSIVRWNPAAEELYGWHESEVVGRHILSVLAPVAGSGPLRMTLDRVLAGEEWSGDRVVLRRDGTPIKVYSRSRALRNHDGEVVGIVGMAADVTDRRVAEQRMRELAEHSGLALEAGGLGTWRWDRATGTTVWDERLERLYGLEPGTFDGSYATYMSLVHPDDRELVRAAAQEALDATSSFQLEHRIVRPDGTVRWVYRTGAVTFGEDGEPNGTIGCVVDATDRILEAQERHQRAADALEAATRAQVQHERLQFVLAINDTLTSSESVQEIMANVARAAVPRLGDWCSIHVLPFDGGEIPQSDVAHVDPAMVELARALQQRFPFDPNAPAGLARVMRTKTTEFYPDIDEQLLTAQHASADDRALIERLALRSAIIVPLVKHGRVLGAMQFVMSRSSRRYTPDDVALAEAVAGRIAASIENRRLNEQQRLIAETLQRSLLPASIPRIDGLDIAVRYSAAGVGTEVGGDFYDVFEVEDGMWAVVIGDVCGTGPVAASLTGLARHCMRESAWHGDAPIDVLRSLNRAVLRSDFDSFCTAAFATFAVTSDAIELTVTCGGHPLPVHVRDGRARPLGYHGTLLGVLPEIECETTTTTLRPGDAVVFFTDGATDVAPPYLLSAEQFIALVGRADAPDAERIADQILEQLEAILPFAERNDDLALLVVRVRETPA